eukprot:CAMPEP_0172459386 /NCGR_PEP_ID=MMETSP1065-20121228/32480_1 /TAXON_ID=265537 /ORGANISM="Amphiprora paludosa, Strain CCMP125" /LENGTH=592 /DNA_ID=CAMNT_0013214055 /DNA_START=116 /DNA_END=1895 /DNA_ORIENTATION=+
MTEPDDTPTVLAEETNEIQSTDDSETSKLADVANDEESTLTRREALRAKLRQSEEIRTQIPENDVETLETGGSEDRIEEADDLSTDSPGGTRKTSSRRDALRAKLRQSEERLLKFTRSGDGNENIFGQMAAVTESLKKVEEEKSMLEVELSKLQEKTDDQNDAFLQEKMSGIQEGFQKQVETIQGLQEELSVKDDEITNLREDLVKKLRRIVELEFDLETHSVHFTNYAKEQFKLGEEALAEIKGSRGDQDFAGDASVSSFGDESVRSTMTTSKRGSQRKAQKLISKLLADLDDLEARYKADRLDAASELHRAQMTMEQLRTRIQVLEQEQANLKDETKVEPKIDTTTNTIGPDTGNMQVQVLRKRNQTLEARRILAQKEIDRLHGDVIASKNRTKEMEREHSADLERLRAENDALRARISDLETSQQKKGIMKKMRRNSVEQASSSQFSAIDARIKGSYEKIAVLEAERSVKDRQISTLKNEVASLRMKEIANGKIERTNFTPGDSELLRSPTGRHRMYDMNKRDAADKGGGETDNSYVADLQSQLQEAQQLLVKKDQELVIERAKSASTVAGLLARITELTSGALVAEAK